MSDFLRSVLEISAYHATNTGSIRPRLARTALILSRRRRHIIASLVVLSLYVTLMVGHDCQYNQLNILESSAWTTDYESVELHKELYKHDIMPLCSMMSCTRHCWQRWTWQTVRKLAAQAAATPPFSPPSLRHCHCDDCGCCVPWSTNSVAAVWEHLPPGTERFRTTDRSGGLPE